MSDFPYLVRQFYNWPHFGWIDAVPTGSSRLSQHLWTVGTMPAAETRQQTVPAPDVATQ